MSINGTALDYAETGSGEPLVLVHGTASDRRTWQLQRKTFSGHFRVIAFSRRYHWPNEPIPEGADYSMEEQVEDLKALVDSLDAAPAHFIGHSYGAFLCLLLAIRTPAVVRTLVLAEPPVITIFVSDPPKPLELLRLSLTRPRAAAAILKFGVRGAVPASRAFRKGKMKKGIRTIGAAVLGPGGYDRLPKVRKTQVDDNLESVKAELLGPGFLPLEPDQVWEVQSPTLLLNGERSIGLFHRLADRLEELLPRSERLEIPEAAHMMHEDNPEAFNAAVLAFLLRYSQTG